MAFSSHPKLLATRRVVSKVLGHGVAVLRQLSGGRFFFKYITKQPRVDQETFLKCKSNRKSRGRILSFATKASRIISLITQKVKVKLFYHNDCLDCKIHSNSHFYGMALSAVAAKTRTAEKSRHVDAASSKSSEIQAYSITKRRTLSK